MCWCRVIEMTRAGADRWKLASPTSEVGVLPRLSYDDKQREAILVRCLKCHKFYWMTVATFVCVSCR
jgi:hypothetical protein